MKNLSLKIGVLAVGLFGSSVGFAATYLQMCGGGTTAIYCNSPQALDSSYNWTSGFVYDVLKYANCSLSESKVSLMNTSTGVDTYKCASGDFKGVSFQIFYNRSSDSASVIVMY